MFCLIEAVEIVVRRHLNVGNVHTLGGDFVYKEVILSEALGSKKVLDLWNMPLKYEKYLLELLRTIVVLWITIRGHAFAHEWTLKFERRYSKGIRKTLKS